jgi:hypothetical protein
VPGTVLQCGHRAECVHYILRHKLFTCACHLLQMPGYSTAMKRDSAEAYEYPHGAKWKQMFAKGLFPDPCKQTVFVCPAN